MQLKRILAVLCVCGVASAQTPPAAPQTRSLTLEEAIQMALQHNLDIQIQRYNPDIDLYNLRASYGGWDPSFNLRAVQSYTVRPGAFSTQLGTAITASETYVENFSAGIGGVAPTGLQYDISGNILRTSGPGRPFQYTPAVGITLSQPLLRNMWIDNTRFNILVNKKTLRISELGLARQIMDTITRVEQAYYQLIAARENVKVQEKALELAQRSLDQNKTRVQVGALAPLDEKQAESLVASSKADLLLAQQTLSIRENALKSLVTDDFAKVHSQTFVPSESLLPVVVPFELTESWRRALTMRPDIQQSRIDLERRDITIKYQKNQIYPALDLIGSYGRNGIGGDTLSALDTVAAERFPNWSFGAQLSIPIGNITARNRLKVSKAQKAQALLVLHKLEQDIMVEVDNAVKLAQADFERIEATRQARVYAEAALEAEQKKLESGKSTSFEVLSLQRDLTLRRSQEIQALADYNNALSGLSFSEGRTLERNGITISPAPSK